MCGDAVTVVASQTESSQDVVTSEMRFGSSDDLQTSYLVWHNNDRQQAQVFHTNLLGLSRSFRLHDALALEPHSYALALSGDGTQLSWAADTASTLD